MGPEFWGLPTLWHGLSLELEGRWVAGLSALDGRLSCPVVQRPPKLPPSRPVWVLEACVQAVLGLPCVSAAVKAPRGVWGATGPGWGWSSAVVLKTTDMQRP